MLDAIECVLCPAHMSTAHAARPLGHECRLFCNKNKSALHNNHYDAARGGLGCGESSASVCKVCPAGSSLFENTTEHMRNAGVRSCVCNEIYYGSIGAACTACVCLLLQYLLQSCSRGGGGEQWRTCATRDCEPRPAWTSLPITH
jgi:hypothetical protein